MCAVCAWESPLYEKLIIKKSFSVVTIRVRLSWSQTGPKLVADLQWAGIWPIIRCSELAWASRSVTGDRSATSLGPVCDQDSITEFGFELGWDQVRAISTCRDSSNLVADQFAAGLSQIPLRYPGYRQVRGWSQTCLDDRPNSSMLQDCDQLRTCLRPG